MNLSIVHGIVGCAIFICFLFMFKYAEGTWAPPAIIFVAGYFSSTYLYSNASIKSELHYADFAYENFDEALWLTSSCFIGLFLGYAAYWRINYRKQIGNIYLNHFMHPRTASIIAKLIMSAAIFLVYYGIASGAYSEQRGESSYLTDASVSIFSKLGFITVQTFAPLALALYIAIIPVESNVRETLTRYVLFAIVFIFYSTLVGLNRQLGVVTILLFGLIYHFRVKKLRPKHFLVILSALFLLQFVRGLRDLRVPVSEMNISMVTSFVSSYDFSSLLDVAQSITTGIAGWDVFTNALDIVPNNDNYKFGSTYFQSLIGIFTPRSLGLGSYEELIPSAWYLKMYSPDTVGHGYDFSMLAEAYINFGYLMPLFFILIGIALAWLSRTIRQTSSPEKLFFCTITLVALMLGLRSDSNSALKSAFYHSIPIIMLVRYLNYRYRNIPTGL